MHSPVSHVEREREREREREIMHSSVSHVEREREIMHSSVSHVFILLSDPILIVVIVTKSKLFTR